MTCCAWRERISIRDFSTILEAIAEATSASTDLLSVTEHVRSRLARQLCNMHVDASGALPVVALSPNWEQIFAEALVGQGADRQLASGRMHRSPAAFASRFSPSSTGSKN